MHSSMREQSSATEHLGNLRQLALHLLQAKLSPRARAPTCCQLVVAVVARVGENVHKPSNAEVGVGTAVVRSLFSLQVTRQTPAVVLVACVKFTYVTLFSSRLGQASDAGTPLDSQRLGRYQRTILQIMKRGETEIMKLRTSYL